MYWTKPWNSFVFVSFCFCIVWCYRKVERYGGECRAVFGSVDTALPELIMSVRMAAGVCCWCGVQIGDQSVWLSSLKTVQQHFFFFTPSCPWWRLYLDVTLRINQVAFETCHRVRYFIVSQVLDYNVSFQLTACFRFLQFVYLFSTTWRPAENQASQCASDKGVCNCNSDPNSPPQISKKVRLLGTAHCSLRTSMQRVI